jgi:teichoic acid transport system permease protein
MSLAEYAAREGLHKVGGRPPLRTYLIEVWRRREFAYALARFRIEAENQTNRLGMGWVVLRPLINAMVYGAIFGVLLGKPGRPPHFIEFLIIGVFMFEFFSSCFTSGAKSITSNTALVQSLSFPRMALPLALVVQRLLQFVPMIVIMLIIVMAFGTTPKLQWLLMVPLIGLFTLFNIGLTLITARLTVHFRDLSQLLPFIARFFFFTSGIFFSVDVRFKDHPRVLQVADFVPIHEFLSLGRSLLLQGRIYDVKPEYWLYGTVWSVATLAVGTVFFWAAEERYGRTD